MVGGVVLSIGNLSTQYAWALVGLSGTDVVSGSITVIIGSTLNYFLDDRNNRAQILFPGVGCFFIAFCLGSAVHSSNIADDEAKLNNLLDDYKDGAKLINISCGKEINGESIAKSKDLESGEVGSVDMAKVGTTAFLIEVENTRAIKVFGKSTFIGLAVAFFAGLCFSLFSSLFNLATNDQWHALKEGVPHLTVYTSFSYLCYCRCSKHRLPLQTYLKLTQVIFQGLFGRLGWRRLGLVGWSPLWRWEWSSIHGWSSCRICSSRCCSVSNMQ